MALIVSPYLIWNLMSFDHIIPISGAIKSTFPHPEFKGSVVKVGWVCLFFAALEGILSLHKKTRIAISFIALAIGYCLQILYIVVFTHHHTGWNWYYVTGIFVMAISVSRIFNAHMFRNSLKHITLIAAILVCIFIPSMLWLRFTQPGTVWLSDLAKQNTCRERWPILIGRWLCDHLPRGTRIAVVDWPGMLAYFSGLQIFPLDGLVNNFQYNKNLLRYGTVEYFHRRGITYIIIPLAETGFYPWYKTTFTDTTVELSIMAPLNPGKSRDIALHQKDMVIRFKEVINCNQLGDYDFAMWKVP